MPISATVPKQLVTPTQVWAHVPTELQQRTIQLMAQLAMNLVVAQTPQSELGQNEGSTNADPD